MPPCSGSFLTALVHRWEPEDEWQERILHGDLAVQRRSVMPAGQGQWTASATWCDCFCHSWHMYVVKLLLILGPFWAIFNRSPKRWFCLPTLYFIEHLVSPLDGQTFIAVSNRSFSLDYVRFFFVESTSTNGGVIQMQQPINQPLAVDVLNNPCRKIMIKNPTRLK